ncbi:MAG: 16S rRNA (cytosine(967)-C(5))-methyltransferase RsmB [Firmicutes bacterium]|nr:16S rRNA (cytosine(967)-C(5))-methyltransferase RsmB [Bacillota bacterium]
MTVVKNPREIALRVLMAVESKNAYANLALNAALGENEIGKPDRALSTELVYGSLRALHTLDWALEQHLRKPLGDLPVPVRNILRLGAYQILFMQRIPPSAAVNEAVKLTRRYGHAGTVRLVNGVLRNLARGGSAALQYPDPAAEPAAYLALRYAHPNWLVRRWLDEFGFAAAETMLQFNNRPAPNTVRVNTLKTDLAALQSSLRARGIEAVKGQYAEQCLHLEGFVSLGSLPQFKAGLFQVQDESSILVGQALNPPPGARVIDLAAAPGGKTTHLAQLMQNKGEIMAFDVHEHKINLIKDNCRRLGVEIVRPILADARKIPLLYPQLQADYVLVDAPCSGLGVLRRRPEARWRKEEAQIKELAALQEQILEAAHRLLKPGGVLVYSTCTMTAEENLGQLAAFLAKFPAYKPESLLGLLPETLDCRHTMAKGYLQILPHLHNGPDGFFMARLRKNI